MCFLVQAYPAQEDAGAISSPQQPIACVISKQESHKGKRSRGYIAMLSVERSWRRKGIGEFWQVWDGGFQNPNSIYLYSTETGRDDHRSHARARCSRGKWSCESLQSDCLTLYFDGQVILETEYDNLASLTLYGSLGFFREKRLHRFYLNGKDAYVYRTHDSRTLKPEPLIRLGLNRYRLVLPLPSQDTDDEDSGAISDSQSEKSLARARLSSAADWVIANGEETVSTQDIERHSRAGGQYLSDKGHDTKREIASILEGIDRTDIA
jgi:peptide alpha-N-acetyltransferase